MIGVNRPPLERRDTRLHKSSLVQCIGVDRDLRVRLFGDGKTGVDRCRGGSPILMQLQTERACGDLLTQRLRLTGVTFPKKTEIDRITIGGLEHPLNMPWARRASGGEGSMGRPSSASDQGGDPGSKRIVD